MEVSCPRRYLFWGQVVIRSSEPMSFCKSSLGSPGPYINEWKRRDLLVHVGAFGLEALAAETHTVLCGFLKGPQIPAERV